MSKRKTSAVRDESFLKKQKTFYTHESKTIDFSQAQAKAPKVNTRPVVLVPKTLNQEKYIIALLDDETDIVAVSGPAGTGKTYLAMQAAVKALRSRACDRIILTRPAVAVEAENHGFLPGTLNQKMEPWLAPLFDVLYQYYTLKEVAGMMEDQVLEIAPLGFMRGRTFRRSYIIADEMQNATQNQILMLLTRIGEGSKMVLTGDLCQRDRQFYEDNGLTDLFSRLDKANSTSIRHLMLTGKDVQRHRVVSEVLALYGEM